MSFLDIYKLSSFLLLIKHSQMSNFLIFSDLGSTRLFTTTINHNNIFIIYPVLLFKNTNNSLLFIFTEIKNDSNCIINLVGFLIYWNLILHVTIQI